MSNSLSSSLTLKAEMIELWESGALPLENDATGISNLAEEHDCSVTELEAILRPLWARGPAAPQQTMSSRLPRTSQTPRPTQHPDSTPSNRQSPAPSTQTPQTRKRGAPANDQQPQTSATPPQKKRRSQTDVGALKIEHQSEVERLKREVENYKDLIRTMKADREWADKKAAAIKKSQLALRQTYDREVEDLSNKIQDQEAEIDGFIERRDKDEAEFREQTTLLRQTIDNLQQDIYRRDHDSVNRDAELKRLREAAGLAEARNNELQAKVKSLEEKVNNCKGCADKDLAMGVMKKKLDEADNCTACPDKDMKLNALKGDVVDLKKKLEDMEGKLESCQLSLNGKKKKVIRRSNGNGNGRKANSISPAAAKRLVAEAQTATKIPFTSDAQVALEELPTARHGRVSTRDRFRVQKKTARRRKSPPVNRTPTPPPDSNQN